MGFEWILSPITNYAVLVLGLAACLFLFVTVKIELQALRSVVEATPNPAEGNAEIEELRGDLRILQERPAALLPGPALNVTRRMQALRMHHRGEAIETIAAALSAPRNEIELMLKLHRIQGIQDN